MDEAHVALWAEIGLAVLALDQSLLGHLDRGEYRRGARVGAVDPNAEVDRVVAFIGFVELDERQQRVCGLGLELFEHARPLP